MSKYEINYPKMIDEALHQVVRDVLGVVSKQGLKDNHHFFISFMTNFPGVELSKIVREQYPQEITIVVQYQFKSLVVRDKAFSIKLSFNGIEENVVVPYKAITAFSDPSEKMSLQFNYYSETKDTKADNDTIQVEELLDSSISDEEHVSSNDDVESSNIIQLDKFRQPGDKS